MLHRPPAENRRNELALSPSWNSSNQRTGLTDMTATCCPFEYAYLDEDVCFGVLPWSLGD